MRLAVLIPHKDREEYKDFQKDYLTKFLDSQGIEHQIFLCEQQNDNLFSRSLTINHAFKYAWETYKPDYVVIQDVDMVPLNMDYRYLGFAEVWFGTAGGVKILSTDFLLAGGFNNEFRGWGYEDSEFVQRLRVNKVFFQVWKDLNPHAELIDLEMRPSNSLEHSQTYYGYKNGPRMYHPTENDLTKHLTVKYPKTWLTASNKRKNAVLCQSVEKMPNSVALNYFKKNGLNQVRFESVEALRISDTVMELYWK